MNELTSDTNLRDLAVVLRDQASRWVTEAADQLDALRTRLRTAETEVDALADAGSDLRMERDALLAEVKSLRAELGMESADPETVDALRQRVEDTAADIVRARARTHLLDPTITSFRPIDYDDSDAGS